MEDIRREFKVFGEALEIQTQKLDVLIEDVEILKEEVKEIRVILETKADKSDVADIRRELDEIKRRLDTQGIQREEFETLKHRVAELEMLVGGRAHENA